MHLNIKDPEAHRLAQAISRATGESMTRVVTEALRSRYNEIERRERRASLDELRAIAARSAALVRGKYEAHGDLLYDDAGLPK
ncbi:MULTISPECIES: type II toxin-antitoxin system VapB family antitoxin [Sphingomonas]|uniref:Type II toxin-antitoxin system VapB family antitoxin n=1 Tax=Sphingomonas lycopersici TaxID=2951807 RepID=A0AA41Z988_9SPHN|nr:MULTISPECIES: type II toxin-antitoxin system VapB family antitoxin [Sphingomonas]MCW6532082.1 type II toxin-antitoxin system VapB family antitoxin [Sphingomonas lycopersici]MCW6535840.1 type II toxin-antitoxin system VapB family antitoxin [Sphingomonas lycopersici]OJU15310.1 MAG: transcription factor [Sphingomonas sp. 66-10]